MKAGQSKEEKRGPVIGIQELIARSVFKAKEQPTT